MGDIRNHQWLLSLREKGAHKCGAALINPDKALTAAHCYNIDIAARSYSVYGGSNYRSSKGDLANVRRIYLHPGYKYDEMINDLAVVWLLKSFSIGRFINPIPMANQNEVLPRDVMATIAGWGYQAFIDDFSEELYETNLPVLSSKDCSSIYGKQINVMSVICAGYVEGGSDSTGGDSGGPLVFNKKLYGIVSWGASSSIGNSKYVGIYTSVAAYRHWIDEAMTEEYIPIYTDGY